MELQRFVERINREKDEIAIHNVAIKEIVAEAKEAGHVPKHLRQIVRESRLEPDVRKDHLATLDQMRRELGWLADTPLGEAALRAINETPVGNGPAGASSGGTDDADTSSPSPVADRNHLDPQDQGRAYPLIGEASSPSNRLGVLRGGDEAAIKLKPFAEQPVHQAKPRGRPRKVLFDQEHPHGT